MNMIGQDQVKSSEPRFFSYAEILEASAQKCAEKGIRFYSVLWGSYDDHAENVFFSDRLFTEEDFEEIAGDAMAEAAEAHMRDLDEFDRELLEKRDWNHFDINRIMNAVIRRDDDDCWVEHPFMDAMARRGFTLVSHSARVSLNSDNSVAGGEIRGERPEDRRIVAKIVKHLHRRGILPDGQKADDAL
jgi:hypothetical protein